MLTDIAPPEAVIEYNDYAIYSLITLGTDYYIYPNNYYDMKKRLNYSKDKIMKDINIIYSKEIIDEYNRLYDSNNNLKDKSDNTYNVERLPYML